MGDFKQIIGLGAQPDLLPVCKSTKQLPIRVLYPSTLCRTKWIRPHITLDSWRCWAIQAHQLPDELMSNIFPLRLKMVKIGFLLEDELKHSVVDLWDISEWSSHWLPLTSRPDRWCQYNQLKYYLLATAIQKWSKGKLNQLRQPLEDILISCIFYFLWRCMHSNYNILDQH